MTTVLTFRDLTRIHHDGGRRRDRPRRRRPQRRARRARGRDRPQWMWEVDAAQPGRRPRPTHPRLGHRGRPGAGRHARRRAGTTPAPPCRLRLPRSEPTAHPDRHRERHAAPRARGRLDRRCPPTGRPRARGGGRRGVRRPLPRSDLGWTAPAGGHRPSAGGYPTAHPGRRAHRSARRGDRRRASCA